MAQPRRVGRWLGVFLLVLIAALFSFLNAGERATVNLGYTVMYRVSLVGLVFIVFLLGMVAMFLFSLAYDRKVRAALREQQRPRYPVDPFSYPHPPESIE